MARPRPVSIESPGKVEKESLSDEIDSSEQEARMVLPGIQALFGFQLVAVFSANFEKLLSPGLQRLHLVALVSVALAVMLVLTPAAYHRQAEAGQVSMRLARITSFFLTAGMVPMMAGIVLDVYVITRVITLSLLAADVISAGLFVGFVSLWFVFPNYARRKIARTSARRESPGAAYRRG